MPSQIPTSVGWPKTKKRPDGRSDKILYTYLSKIIVHITKVLKIKFEVASGTRKKGGRLHRRKFVMKIITNLILDRRSCYSVPPFSDLGYERGIHTSEDCDGTEARLE